MLIVVPECVSLSISAWFMHAWLMKLTVKNVAMAKAEGTHSYNDPRDELPPDNCNRSQGAAVTVCLLCKGNIISTVNVLSVADNHKEKQKQRTWKHDE